MKTDKFSESLNNIDDKYIDEAVKCKNSEKTSKNKNKKDINYPKSMKIWRGIAIAACAVIVCGLGIVLIASGLFAGTSTATVNEIAYEEEIFFEETTSAAYFKGAGSDSGTYVDGYVIEAETVAEEATGAYIYEAGDEASYYAVNTSDSASASSADQSAKIIYTVYMDMQTTDFDKSESDIDAAVEKAGGYFENANTFNGNSSYRNACYTIRVPAENLDSFLEDVKKSGTVISISKNSNDVSEYYYDTESRLETARLKLSRLQELLSEAEDMTDIITLESEISSTEYEIDSLEGSLKSYDSQVSYSTVTIDLSEVYKVEEETAPLTFGERISSSFNNGIKGFGEFLEDTAVWFASSWIWILIIAAVVVAVVVIVKKVRKNKA